MIYCIWGIRERGGGGGGGEGEGEGERNRKREERKKERQTDRQTKWKERKKSARKASHCLIFKISEFILNMQGSLWWQMHWPCNFQRDTEIVTQYMHNSLSEKQLLFYLLIEHVIDCCMAMGLKNVSKTYWKVKSWSRNLLKYLRDLKTDNADKFQNSIACINSKHRCLWKIIDRAACVFNTSLASFNFLFLAAFYSAVFAVQLDSSFSNCPEWLRGQNGIIKQIRWS